MAIPINNVTIDTIKTDSVVVRWTSTLAGTSLIEYGNTTSYGKSTIENSLAYFHEHTLTGLSPGTTYNFRIRTKDYSGIETISSNNTFITRTQTQLESVIKAARVDGALPKIYYVSPSGNDANNGLSISTAWKTLGFASSKLDAGDTLYLMSGTWTNDPINSLNRSGIDVAPITIKAYTGAKPILKGTTAVDAVLADRLSYIIFDGYEAFGYASGGSIAGTHNTINNCYVHDTSDIGLFLSDPGASFITVENCKIVNSGWNQLQLTASHGSVSPDVRFITIRNNSISHNYAHNGIDLFGNIEYVKIENNDMFDGTDNLIFDHNSPDKQRYISIMNNYFHDTRWIGINFEEVSSSIIGYNQFKNIVDNVPIYIYSNSNNIAVIYNNFDNTLTPDYEVPVTQIGNTYGQLTGTLDISSVPLGAEIFIDGIDQSKVTRSVIQNIPAGNHTLKLTLAGYQDYTTSFVITGGQTTTLNPTLTPVSPTTGTLDVSSVPLGAEIFIDGADQNKVTRSVIQSIPVGNHTLKLTLSGYQDYTTTFTITEGATAILNPTLTPVSPTTCPTIQLGSRGDAVFVLQNKLQQLGYFAGGLLDGVFGAHLDYSVRVYQKAKGLTVDGVVRPSTWTSLGVTSCSLSTCPIVQIGTAGSLVITLQTRLKQLGYYTGALDGIYGPDTIHAVINYKITKRLAVDDVVGTYTWTSLGIMTC